MHEDVAGRDDSSLDRRALIKKIGVAGAIAWTAPVVMDSVLSPAAAQSNGDDVPPGAGRVILFSGNFNGVASDPGGNDYAVHGTGGLAGAPGWVVGANTNVDGVAVPAHGSAAFGAEGSTTVIELGGTGQATPGQLSRAFGLPGAGNYRFIFSWNNRSDHSATVSVSGGSNFVSGFADGTLGDAGNTSLHTFSQTFVVDSAGPVTITFLDSEVDSSGVQIGEWRLETAP